MGSNEQKSEGCNHRIPMVSYCYTCQRSGSRGNCFESSRIDVQHLHSTPCGRHRFTQTITQLLPIFITKSNCGNAGRCFRSNARYFHRKFLCVDEMWTTERPRIFQFCCTELSARRFIPTRIPPTQNLASLRKVNRRPMFT